MERFFSMLFDASAYMPHGYCFLWMPDILWMHIIGDVVTAMAYYSIPATLLYIMISRRKSLPFRWVFVLFAAFILLCGTTHIIGLITLWYPIYFIEGIVKCLTAAVSIVTAILLYPLTPRLLDVLADAKDAKAKK